MDREANQQAVEILICGAHPDDVEWAPAKGETSFIPASPAAIRHPSLPGHRSPEFVDT
jgi:hypothetical protein